MDPVLISDSLHTVAIRRFCFQYYLVALSNIGNPGVFQAGARFCARLIAYISHDLVHTLRKIYSLKFY